MQTNIAAIIITYYPQEAVIANIQSFGLYCSKLYVYDNTPTADPVLRAKLEAIPRLSFFHDGKNRGISERLNAGCRAALADGVNWVLTMDQDTSFAVAAIANYIHCFLNYADKEVTAAIGVKYSRTVYEPDGTCRVEEVDDVITSGMLLNVNVWQQTGGFDEALFIDSVDHEYCVRTRMQGFKIVRFDNVAILHEIGTVVYNSSIKSLYTIRKHKVIHSPLRCYYMYRNMLYLENKYRESNIVFSKLIRKYVEGHMRTCLLYARQRPAIQKYIRIAKEDFANGQMGKIQPDRLVK